MTPSRLRQEGGGGTLPAGPSLSLTAPMQVLWNFALCVLLATKEEGEETSEGPTTTESQVLVNNKKPNQIGQ
jgi:hypothetical protein